MMELDIIFQLAFSLTCRTWMNFLCACTELDPVQMVGAVDVLLRHQEHYTALDWIVACKRRAQLRLPERCESRQQRESVRLQGSTLVEAEVIDRHVSKDTGIMYGIALLEGERIAVVRYEREEYFYLDMGEIVR